MKNRLSQSIAILAVACLLSSGAALAANGNGQGQGKPGAGGPDNEWTGGPMNRVARMSGQLGLTAEQEDAVLSFFRERQAEREAMQARIAETFGDEICAQRAANRADFEALLLAILDDEQWTRHEAMQARRAERQANRGERRGRGGFECPADD
jgi:hypothetical protein